MASKVKTIETMTVNEKLSRGLYENQRKEPVNPHAVCECGKKFKESEITKFCPDCGLSTKAIRERREQYNKDLKYYREGEDEAHAKFRADALEECGITNHPKADLAWSMAWDRGHACRKYEVYSNLVDLAQLLK